MTSNILAEIYPDPEAIFKKESATLREALEHGIIVLDTNTLLLPYLVDQNSFKEVMDVYENLKSQNRLYIPYHVAREFAQKRVKKLGDALKVLKDKKGRKFEVLIYRLFEEFSEFKDILELNKKMSDLSAEIDEKLQALINKINDFERNDPVTIAYRDLIDNKILIDKKISESDLAVDLKRRTDYQIPPGHNDGRKNVNLEDDLLIWHTILRIGQDKQNDLVFISHDKNPDWQQCVNKMPFQPRYELIEEYRRHSGGKSFHIATLQELLEITGATKLTQAAILFAEQNIVAKNLSPLTISKVENEEGDIELS